MSTFIIDFGDYSKVLNDLIEKDISEMEIGDVYVIAERKFNGDFESITEKIRSDHN